MGGGLVLLIILIASLSLSVQPVNSQQGEELISIIIHSDGRVEPESAPIISTDNRTYVLTRDVRALITIYRDGIVLDGNGYKIYGNITARYYYPVGTTMGYAYPAITLRASNITIKNLRLEKFGGGILLFTPSISNITIDNVEAKDISFSVIYAHYRYDELSKFKYPKIDGLTIVNSYLESRDGYAIHLDAYGEDILIKDNTLVGGIYLFNDFVIVYGDPVYMPLSNNSILFDPHGYFTNVTIVDNVIHDRLFLYRISNSLIERNNIVGEDGVVLGAVKNTIFRDNIVETENYGLIMLNLIVKASTIVGPDDIPGLYKVLFLGISVEDVSEGNTIEYNIITTNGAPIILTDPEIASKNNFNGNRFNERDVLIVEEVNGRRYSGGYAAIYIINSTDITIEDADVLGDIMIIDSRQVHIRGLSSRGSLKVYDSSSVELEDTKVSYRPESTRPLFEHHDRLFSEYVLSYQLSPITMPVREVGYSTSIKYNLVTKGFSSLTYYDGIEIQGSTQIIFRDIVVGYGDIDIRRSENIRVEGLRHLNGSQTLIWRSKRISLENIELSGLANNIEVSIVTQLELRRVTGRINNVDIYDASEIRIEELITEEGMGEIAIYNSSEVEIKGVELGIGIKLVEVVDAKVEDSIISFFPYGKPYITTSITTWTRIHIIDSKNIVFSGNFIADTSTLTLAIRNSENITVTRNAILAIRTNGSIFNSRNVEIFDNAILYSYYGEAFQMNIDWSSTVRFYNPETRRGNYWIIGSEGVVSQEVEIHATGSKKAVDPYPLSDNPTSWREGIIVLEVHPPGMIIGENVTTNVFFYEGGYALINLYIYVLTLQPIEVDIEIRYDGFEMLTGRERVREVFFMGTYYMEMAILEVLSEADKYSLTIDLSINENTHSFTLDDIYITSWYGEEGIQVSNTYLPRFILSDTPLKTPGYLYLPALRPINPLLINTSTVERFIDYTELRLEIRLFNSLKEYYAGDYPPPGLYTYEVFYKLRGEKIVVSRGSVLVVKPAGKIGDVYFYTPVLNIVDVDGTRYLHLKVSYGEIPLVYREDGIVYLNESLLYDLVISEDGLLTTNVRVTSILGAYPPQWLVRSLEGDAKGAIVVVRIDRQVSDELEIYLPLRTGEVEYNLPEKSRLTISLDIASLEHIQYQYILLSFEKYPYPIYVSAGEPVDIEIRVGGIVLGDLAESTVINRLLTPEKQLVIYYIPPEKRFTYTVLGLEGETTEPQPPPDQPPSEEPIQEPGKPEDGEEGAVEEPKPGEEEADRPSQEEVGTVGGGLPTTYILLGILALAGATITFYILRKLRTVNTIHQEGR